MLIKSKNRLPVLASDKLDEFPVLPLRTGVLFPGTMLTIHVGRAESLYLVKYCVDGGRKLIAAHSPMQSAGNDAWPVCQVATLAIVRDSRQGPGESLLVTIEGIQRVVINELVADEPFLKATANYLAPPKSTSSQLKDQISNVTEIVDQITQLDPTYSPEQLHILKRDSDDAATLADKTASIFHLPLASKQELLEAISPKERLKRLLFHLNVELDKAATIHNINASAKKAVEEDQRNLFLRQQLNEIRKQLGEDFAEEKEASRIRKTIKNSPHLPAEVASRAMIEADRLSQITTASAEFGVTKNYLDWILALPWERTCPEDYNITDVERILSNEFFGPDTLKEQVLQRLSVRKLMGGVNEGPTLCLVGAPGTGKASLAKAIAKSLGKEFIRISVGGIAESSEIKGTSRTFLGAMPGKVIRTLRDAGTCDPVILIEDIDYFNIDNDSSVNMALLEVIDVRKNAKFLDHYLGVPFDLSKVFFICSVRSFEDIPEQFVQRLEILEFPGYIEREKITISKKYLIPQLLKKHGITRSELKFSDKILAKIITGYTQESGLLAFSQQIEKICRKVALAKAE
ncbi:MAG: LON peptidase substrate-binding domain-containing protein, partial [candidate division Zixibacteria bacterium]|nr:LON peptidase substrate-binding domain-containing protein [candidate division Zixibacteria bacterium]